MAPLSISRENHCFSWQVAHSTSLGPLKVRFLCPQARQATLVAIRTRPFGVGDSVSLIERSALTISTGETAPGFRLISMPGYCLTSTNSQRTRKSTARFSVPSSKPEVSFSASGVSHSSSGIADQTVSRNNILPTQTRVNPGGQVNQVSPTVVDLSHIQRYRTLHEIFYDAICNPTRLKRPKGMLSFLNAQMRLGAYSYAAPSRGIDDVRFRPASLAVRYHHTDHASGLACRGIFSPQPSTPELAVRRSGHHSLRSRRGRLLHLAT